VQEPKEKYEKALLYGLYGTVLPIGRKRLTRIHTGTQSTHKIKSNILTSAQKVQ
jgi:hypothetical protein